MTNAELRSPTRIHLSRLMKIWRSAGWPVRDAMEMDLLAGKWATISVAPSGHETLLVTDAGLKLLMDARERRRQASSAHNRLAQRVGQYLMDSGRIVWREVSFRAQFNAGQTALGTEDAGNGMLSLEPERNDPHSIPVREGKMSWRIARPDIFSVRNTSVEDYLHPIVHEIKTNRADLLSDLRNAPKRGSYRWLCCECFYVFPVGTAEAEEIPADFGVLALYGGIEDGRLQLLRPARHFPCKLPFAAWLTLAKAVPIFSKEDSADELAVCNPREENARI